MPKKQQPPRRFISPNNPVRRRLFFDNDTDAAKNENFTNALKESFARETFEKSLKWNYDFENDTPLNNLDGIIEWSTISDDRYDLIGKIKTPLTEVKIQEVNVQEENETTPRARNEVKRAVLPRKRKSESDSFEAAKEIRRKISFD